jgi:ribA/ribD-fused uncharacterized protein
MATLPNEDALYSILVDTYKPTDATSPITSFSGENFFLSNFYITPVMYNNILYPTAEHAYQAQKTGNSHIHKIFANQVRTARDAKTLGHGLKLREDWSNIKLLVMFNIVRIKFDSNPEIKAKLIATDTREIIEGNDWGDVFYGVCNGVGENHLGKILMTIRDSYIKNLF